MTTRTVGAERFDTHGRRVEEVDISLNVFSERAFLTIDGKKRSQQFAMNRASWLEIARLQLGKKRYAVCWAHMADAVRVFVGLNAHMRELPADANYGTCHCGEPANVYFMEVEGKLDQTEMPPGSYARAHPNG